MTPKISYDYTPEEAIAYLKSKGFAIGYDWTDVWKEAHKKSFTVAKAMQEDILADIKAMTEKALSEGITYKQFIQELEPKLKAKGWWGKQEMVNPKTGEKEVVQLGSAARLNTIYRTNLQSSYQCGRYQQMTDVSDGAGGKIKSQYKYWQYLAVMDSKTRPWHAALNGKIFRQDDPIWQKIYPPNGFNCRCTVRALTEYDLNKAAITPQVMEDGQLKYSFSNGIVEDGNKVLSQLKSEGLEIDKGFDYMPCDLRQITQKPVVTPKPTPPVVTPKPQPSVVTPKPQPLQKENIDIAKEWSLVLEDLKKYHFEKDPILYVKKLNESNDMFEEYIKHLNSLSEYEIKIEREKIIDRMLIADSSYIDKPKQDVINVIYKGTKHISNRLIADLERSGLKYKIIHIERPEFNLYDGIIRISNKSDYSVVAHETAHAIDSLMSSGGKGLYNNKGLMGNWNNTPYVLEKEVVEYKKMFDRQKTGVKLNYTNGDGEYWEGDWLTDYEGRIYDFNPLSFGEQFLAVNSQRYSEYKNFDIIKARQYSNRNLGLDVVAGGNKIVRGELIPYTKEEAFEEINKGFNKQIKEYSKKPKELSEPMIQKIKIGKELLNKLYLYSSDKDAADWVARECTQWGNVSRTYPEFSKFIEKFYSRELAT